MTRSLVRIGVLSAATVVTVLGLVAVVAAALIIGVGAMAESIGSHDAEGQPTGTREFASRNAAAHETVSRERLPDLDQETPNELQVHTVVSGGRLSYRIGFRSAVRNIGAGPLIVNGSRPDSTTPYMRADQIIDRVGQPQAVVPGVGRMQYVIASDHRHWHYVQFDRYELRRAGSSSVRVADRKSGFCLGDRYRVTSLALRSASPKPVYTGRCGLAQPALLQMHERISVGYGDDYSAFLEGQELPLDGLADGHYVLVHRVNVDRRLREVSYANNAASVLLDLRWHGGKPSLRTLATCPATDNCADRR
jgi:hypothetical protein